MSRKQVLIIDCQLFHNGTFYRGMGRYSRKLLETMFSKHSNQFSDSEVVFLFNKNRQLEAERKRVLKNIYSKAKWNYINFPLTDFEDTKSDIKYYQVLLDDYIEKNFPEAEVKFLMLSNFETRESLSVFPTLPNVTKLLLFYDLIPHLFYQTYLVNDVVRQDYYGRFLNIFAADHIFTISETTRNDLVKFLGYPVNKVTNIDGALIDNRSTEKVSSELREKVNKFKPYILSVTGDIPHKNNDASVQAFCEFTKKGNSEYTLLLTSTFSEASKTRLLNLRDSIDPSANIIFVGNVNDAELNYLYDKCDLMMFISKYEGLGLPILEAVKHEKKILASNIPVFQEMTKDGVYYCNPENIETIVEQLKLATKTKNLDKNAKKEYAKIINKYKWESTASKFVDIYKEVKSSAQNKKKMALVGPGLNSYSAIAKYLEEIFPFLNEYWNVDFFFDPGSNPKKYRESYLPYCIDYKHVNELGVENYKKYDTVIYNIGNSEFHIEIYKKSLVFPGILVMHDLNLEGMQGFARQNQLIAAERVDMEQLFNNKTEYTLSLINSALGVLVHSKFAEKNIKDKRMYEIPVYKTDLPSTQATLEALKSKDKVLVGLAGLISEVKGLKTFLEIAEELKKYTDTKVEFLVFGYDFGSISPEYQERIKTSGCVFKTNLTEYDYQKELSSLDILINYRPKYNGETSKTCIDAFKYGVVPIVRDIGWFAELPNNAVIKVKKEGEILQALLSLINNPKLLRGCKENLIKMSKEVYTCENYAKSISALEDIIKIQHNNPNITIRKLLRSGVQEFSPQILQDLFLD